MLSIPSEAVNVIVVLKSLSNVGVIVTSSLFIETASPSAWEAAYIKASPSLSVKYCDKLIVVVPFIANPPFPFHSGFLFFFFLSSSFCVSFSSLLSLLLFSSSPTAKPVIEIVPFDVDVLSFSLNLELSNTKYLTPLFSIYTLAFPDFVTLPSNFTYFKSPAF
ncbi:hypothetical protein HYX00_05380 [Candidatus Woesearchaeota archaeon]|nr:hypothetical protein [Candidatus Woesearchaeota archaeon]